LVTAFVDMVSKNIPSPIENAKTKVEHTYLGPMDSELAQALTRCDSEVTFRNGSLCVLPVDDVCFMKNLFNP
jgi:translation elongation factor EF-G